MLIAVMLVCVRIISAQGNIAGEAPSIDRSLVLGFESLSKKDYREARSRFEAAMSAFNKNPQPSEWLFTKLSLPDESESDAVSNDPQVKQITAWRHTMATRQALTMFLAFAFQLEGNIALADKYFDEIYGLQSPMWGRSWRTFVVPLQAVFHTTLPNDVSESYGRYLYRAGLLLEDAGQEIAFTFFERAHKLAPRDAEIAANLASSYVVRLRAAEARSLAQLSLSIEPKQPRVLIDLATAEWLLDEFDSAKKHMTEASLLKPELPGPHGTLTLIAVAENNLAVALKEADLAVKLSERHPYYLTLQAIVLEAMRRSAEADKNVLEAWKGENPSSEQLQKWFLKGKPLEIILKVIERQRRTAKP